MLEYEFCPFKLKTNKQNELCQNIKWVYFKSNNEWNDIYM